MKLSTLVLATIPITPLHLTAQSVEWSNYNASPNATSFTADWQGGSYDVSYSGDVSSILANYPQNNVRLLGKQTGEGPQVLSDVSTLALFTTLDPWTLTFDNFTSVDINSNTRIVLGNLDVGAGTTFTLEAFLGGNQLSTSGWSMVSEYELSNFADEGAPHSWDATNGVLSTSASSNPIEVNSGMAFIQPDSAFDRLEISFLATTPAGSSINNGEFLKLTLGQVPEPSSTLLTGLAAFGFLLRRKR